MQNDLGINLNIFNNNEFISVIIIVFKEFLNNFKEKTKKYLKHKSQNKERQLRIFIKIYLVIDEIILF